MIPRIIHQIWIGSEIPEEFREYAEGWSKNHAEWQHYLWTDKEQRPFSTLKVREIKHLALKNVALYEKVNGPQFRSDLLRYEILFQFGGVYVDADFESQKPIDPLIDVNAFAGWETDGVWINNAILGFQEGDSFLAQVISGLQKSFEQHPGARANRISGPQYLTPLIKRLKPDLTVYPSKYFYPYLWNELQRKGEEFPEAYAVHHWNNRRQRLT